MNKSQLIIEILLAQKDWEIGKESCLNATEVYKAEKKQPEKDCLSVDCSSTNLLSKADEQNKIFVLAI